MYLNKITGTITKERKENAIQLLDAKENRFVFKTPVNDFKIALEFSSMSSAYNSGFSYFFTHENIDIYAYQLQNGEYLYAVCRN